MLEVVNIGPKGARIFEVAFAKHPESFLRVHHPSCGHCKAMEKDWKSLEQKLKSSYNGDIGIFDIHADALPNISAPALKGIQGYPTILAVKDNVPITYEGDRSTDDMLNFCLKHLNLEEILKVYKGGKRKTKRRRTRKTKRRRTRKTKRQRKSRRSHRR